MGKGPRYRVPWRRRREGKTNYYKRIKLILSGKPRFVVRKTNKYIIVQVSEARIEGDRTITVAHSRELAKLYGWKAGTKNTSAAYLTGFLAGLRALKVGVKEAVLDIGIVRPKKGSRTFSALKGGIDAGLSIPHSEEILPSEERIKGLHIAEWARKLSEENPERYKRLFSKYLDVGLKPEDLPKHFEEVLNKIRDDYKDVIGNLKEV